MDDLVIICNDKSRENMTLYLKRLLGKYYSLPKSKAMAISMMDILESKLLRPRSGYLIKLVASTSTGEVFLIVDQCHSHLNKETKVRVKHLKYTRWLPWSKYKIRIN